MSIEKKSLISTLKTTKKANVVKDDISGGATMSPTQKSPAPKRLSITRSTARKTARK